MERRAELSPETPRQRLRRELLAGSPPTAAMTAVAASYGLATEIQVVRSDGSTFTIPIVWRLADFERLLFIKWMVRRRHITEWPSDSPPDIASGDSTAPSTAS